MRKIILAVLLMGGWQSACAQIVQVFDKETGKPLEYVTIQSKKPEAFTTTNAKGQAEISAFKSSAAIEFRSVGFKSLVRSYAELESEKFVVRMEFSVMEIEEVVVSAVRWNQSSNEVPFRIEGIDKKEIALYIPQTAADMLSNTGAVFVQKSQQGGGSPMIRGFSTNRLIYSVDGVRMNTAIFRGGNIQNVISLDPFATESAEVVFGAGSVMYGSDAIGGVMSFSTLLPELSYSDTVLVSGKAVMRYSSANNEMTAHFDVNLGWKKWASVTSFSANRFGDLRMGKFGPDEYLRPFYVIRQDSLDRVVTNADPRLQVPTAYSQMNLMQKIRFRPNEKWDFQYGFHYSETSDYSRYDRHIRYRPNGMPRYGEFDYGPQIWMMNHLSISHEGKNIAYDRMNIRLAQQHFEESRISRNFNSSTRETRVETVDALSVNLDFVKSISDRNKLFYGAEYVFNDVISTGTNTNISNGIIVPGPSRYPMSEWQSFGVFINDQFSVSEKFIVQVGARWNRVQIDSRFDTTFYPFPFTQAQVNNSSLTGSAGFVFRPTEKWVIASNVSTAFRSPNVDDIGKVFDSSPGIVVVPNTNLRSEYAYSADLGLTRMFGKYVKFEMNAYYTYLKDALVRRDFQLNGADSIMYDGLLSRVQAVQNAAEARVYGMQAKLDVKLKSGFGFSSQINIQKGEEEMENGEVSPSRHAAPTFGLTRLSYSKGNINIQVYAQYSAAVVHDRLNPEEQLKTEIYARDANGNTWSPSWYTINFKAMLKVSDYISVSAGVENITDQRYRPYSSGLVAPGRNIILSFRTHF
ncbi:MAG: TonB-dependent receptor domain-containing protein [Flavobacteriales bacterium]